MECLVCKSQSLSTGKYRNVPLEKCNMCEFIRVDVSCDSRQYIDNEASCIEYYKDREDLDRIDFNERLIWINKTCNFETCLDIGANIGIFCDVLIEKDVTVEAVELNKKGYEVCLAKNIVAYNFGIEDLSADKKYDFIHLSDVIEHIANPRKFLMEVNTHLEEKGHMFISTPNFAFSLVWPFQFVPPEHISLFNIKSLSRLCSQTGLEIVATRTRSRTRKFDFNSRNINSNFFLRTLYRSIDLLGVQSYASKIINFFIRENIEIICKKAHKT